LPAAAAAAATTLACSGTSSIQDMVSIVLFNVIPQMADIFVACTYLLLATQVSD
jgi:ABC-type transport system involved in Fe-S cluster assembly fused permease/ATPase subunit